MSVFNIVKLSIWVGVAMCFTASCNSGELSESSPLTKEHPCLILTKDAVGELKSGVKTLPLLTDSYDEVKVLADEAIASGIVVPVPTDPGGGYTHEQHKRNYKAMYNGGIAYQLSGDEKYADFVREMLMEYAKMYPTLGIHPHKKNQAPGKLFWQGLNESVWLVYTAQAYDCVYDYISVEDKEYIEKNLFRKVVEFFTVEDSYSFNRIHNHGTWAAAGVGMTGMVLNDSNYVKMALYGTDMSGEGGFLKQIEQLFSPDGFYTEGPYYQRYAIMPFILFAQALENNQPELGIFEYKDGVLNNAVETLIQLTSQTGKFFPLNDAIKSKDYLSPELIYAVNISYANTKKPELLSIAQKHQKVMLSKQGLLVAQDVAANKTVDFNYKSGVISDGPLGDQGGVVLMRGKNADNKLTLMLKATSQGMGHGHFDRLSFLLYENGEEVIQDYGAARFLNIVQKHGGRYLPENKTWAKQTVAHNTVVVNQESNFHGNLKKASKYHPEIIYTNFDEEVQVAAVVDSHCYKPNVLQRTMALVEYNKATIVVDIFRVLGSAKSTYDLPIYYKGQIITSNIEYTVAEDRMQAMKGQNGYEHLWNMAESKSAKGASSLTWKLENRFYTFTSLLDEQSTMYITKIGANDPEFNLRNEPGLLVRQHNAQGHTFVSTIEAHGKVDPINETVEGTTSSVKAMRIAEQTENATAVELEMVDGNKLLLIVSHTSSSEQQIANVDGKEIAWTGNYYYEILKK